MSIYLPKYNRGHQFIPDRSLNIHERVKFSLITDLICIPANNVKGTLIIYSEKYDNLIETHVQVIPLIYLLIIDSF